MIESFLSSTKRIGQPSRNSKAIFLFFFDTLMNQKSGLETDVKVFSKSINSHLCSEFNFLVFLTVDLLKI
jgi:hypothetical protein